MTKLSIMARLSQGNITSQLFLNKKSMERTKKTTKIAPKKAAPSAPKPAARAHKAPVAHGVGRRKSAVAIVWLRPGKGKITVNEKDYKTYFDTDVTRLDAFKPIALAPIASNYDFEANVKGGGLHAQSGAVRLGIARALVAVDKAIKPLLRTHGLITVDSRVKERKKYGQKAARRRFQFVKR